MRVWACLLLLFPLALSAQRVADPNGFSFQPPATFKAFAGDVPVPGPRPQYVFSGSPEGARGMTVLLGISYSASPVQPGNRPEFPDDLNASMIQERWNDMEVYGFRSNYAESQVIAWLDVPLARPIRIGMLSSNQVETFARQSLRELLATIEGPLASRADDANRTGPGDVSDGSPAAAILLVMIVMGVIGFAGWMLLNRKTDRAPPVSPAPMAVPIPAPAHEPPPAPAPMAEQPRRASPDTQAIQPPWAVTKDSPTPETGSDIPPWETRT